VEKILKIEDAENIGDGIGQIGAILSGIAVVVSAVIGIIKLFGGGDSNRE